MADLDREHDACPSCPGDGQPGTVPDRAGGTGRWFAPLAGPAGADADPAGPRPGPGGPSPRLPWPGPAAAAASTPVPAPASPAEAVAMTLAGLRWLATADAADLPTPVQAECLRDLERALAVHTAARAQVLAAFIAQGGHEDDGQGSPRIWLTWQTRVSRPAASAAVGWSRRLREHPTVAAALARAEISQSWARQICEWTDQLPAEHRDQADAILLAAAAGGADLLSLAELAEQIRARLAAPDTDRGDGFADRGLRLTTTLGGAGRLTGDLSARCAAALQAILDTLGKKAGPEDTRTLDQRHHDALDDACQRLIAARCLPDRAGQPVQLQLHMTLDQLLNGIGTPGRPWLPSGFGDKPPAGAPLAGPGDDCDAALAPVVTGRIDHDLADRLAHRLESIWAEAQPGRRRCDHRCRTVPNDDEPDGRGGRAWELSWACAREMIVRHAVALLSGPDALASWLRTGCLPKPAASVSLPLDIGTVADLVPPHLRRAIITRDKHCAAPGCDQPPQACHVHHIVPRSQGGTTSLTNCLLLCPFHHLILIHRWGWTMALNADGTTTMTSPDGRALHSHSPPAAA